jgi:glycosyltransferase involved in cell wall biosynthesis
VAADCLVLPSEANETWGLVINEAMATGLPCIASRAAGCAEDLVMALRPDLCFDVGSVGGLETAMQAVMASPPSPCLLLDHIAKYDVDRTVDTVEALYFEQPRPMIASGHRPA